MLHGKSFRNVSESVWYLHQVYMYTPCKDRSIARYSTYSDEASIRKPVENLSIQGVGWPALTCTIITISESILILTWCLPVAPRY